jgi:hypothetical protein
LTAGAWLVVALRVVVPLAIPRYPLAGGVAAVIADATDVVLIELIGLGGFGDHYHSLDKLLDTYYLAIEWAVALGWENPWATWPAILLFPYRVIGVLLFELTDRRVMLFAFPNLFENWWLYCVFVARSAPRAAPGSWQTLLVPMSALLALKMGQEYLLHYREAQPWDWTKEHILRGRL